MIVALVYMPVLYQSDLAIIVILPCTLSAILTAIRQSNISSVICLKCNLLKNLWYWSTDLLWSVELLFASSPDHLNHPPPRHSLSHIPLYQLHGNTGSSINITISNGSIFRAHGSMLIVESQSVVIVYHLKLTFWQYPRYTPITAYQTAPNYNTIIIFETVLRQKGNLEHEKILNSTVLPSLHFGMHHQGFAAASPTCPAYDAGRKSENSSFWKDRIIVASTYRQSVQFGCYVTWVWMANYVYVMTRMLHFYYKFTISRRCRRAWKTSTYAHA